MTIVRRIYIHNLNPEPWTSPTASVGRKAGKMFPMLHKDARLRVYQEAVKEALGDVSMEPFEGPISLQFYFWRTLDDGSKRNQADATNLQKALEDALQKIAFVNDRQVEDVHSRIIEQSMETEPAIVITVVARAKRNVPRKIRRWMEIQKGYCVETNTGAAIAEAEYLQ